MKLITGFIFKKKEKRSILSQWTRYGYGKWFVGYFTSFSWKTNPIIKTSWYYIMIYFTNMKTVRTQENQIMWEKTHTIHQSKKKSWHSQRNSWSIQWNENIFAGLKWRVNIQQARDDLHNSYHVCYTLESQMFFNRTPLHTKSYHIYFFVSLFPALYNWTHVDIECTTKCVSVFQSTSRFFPLQITDNTGASIQYLGALEIGTWQ